MLGLILGLNAGLAWAELTLWRFLVTLLLGLGSALLSATGPLGEAIARILGLGVTDLVPDLSGASACFGRKVGVWSFVMVLVDVACSGFSTGSGSEISSIASSGAFDTITDPLREK